MILPIFPEGGLTSSVITTVWVGVFVIVFFNLRFGWVLSGLVVPGYIVPLLILRPIAAGVIVVEAVLTYWIVWLFSERLNRGRYNALFGRDRFMGLVLASIAVRVTLDGWLLPLGADWLSENLAIRIDWQSNLQSFGLVVISLMANQFWKPGLVRGLVATAVVTGITWLIVRYGLMEFTNFRLSGVSYIYEGLASSILASPKAYIILVLTAFAASQMNVRYGWDFSGVLIPALIALQWYQPLKILSSLAETLVIFALARLVMRLPVLASATIEGGRKLLLFFNVSFAYKLVLGHMLNLFAFDVKITDFYGFGYLLSTLLAIKAHDKDILPRLLRTTLGASLTGAVAGNVAGFLLTWFVPQSLAEAGPPQTGSGRHATKARLLFSAAVGDSHIRSVTGTAPVLSRTQANELHSVIELLEAGSEPRFVGAALAGQGFRLRRDGAGQFAIVRAVGAGRELLMFNPAARRDLAIVVADPAEQPGIAAAALRLFQDQGARWLVVAPPPQRTVQSWFAIDVFRSASRLPELTIGAAPGGTSARLSLAGRSATAIDLAALRRAMPGLPAGFGSAANWPNGGAENAALLLLDEPAIERLAMLDASEAAEAPCNAAPGPAAAPKRSDVAQLAYLRFEIMEPLAIALETGARVPGHLIRAAELAGLEFGRCRLGEQVVWQLSDPLRESLTAWFAPGGDRKLLLETSRADPKALSAATALFPHSGAGAMMIAPDDRGLQAGQRTPFGAASQVLVRAMGDQPGFVVHVRPAPAAHLAANGVADVAIVPDWIEANRNWSSRLERIAGLAGFRPLVVDRGVATAGLEAPSSRSLGYLNQAAEKRSATLWVFREKAPDDQ